jgi:coproporphyrinogen III oxidase
VDRRERKHRLVGRGCNVEFNLLHDNGTKFGFLTWRHVEPILMSLSAWGALAC